MKVFISWSGPRSKELANALRDWLPMVLQYVQPFVSDKDTSPGDRWAQTVAVELENSDFGIICITPENLTSEWILFEAGALSKSMQNGKVIPLLFGLDLSDLIGPLSQFQAKKVDQNGLMDVVQAINSIAETKALEDIIVRSVPAMWPTLQTAINAIPDKEPTEEHKRHPDEILEELVTRVRGISSRMRELDPEMLHMELTHPERKDLVNFKMLEEHANFFQESADDPIMILVISGLVRAKYPWLSEILTEAYRELKHASPIEAEMISHRLHRVLKEILRGPLSKSLMRRDSGDYFVITIELPDMIKRIIDRSIYFNRNSSMPEDSDTKFEDPREE